VDAWYPPNTAAAQRTQDVAGPRLTQTVSDASADETTAAIRFAAQLAQIVLERHKDGGSPYGTGQSGLVQWPWEQLTR
jgi:hypothetical protein